MRLVMKLSAFLLSCVIGAAAMAQDGLADHKLALQISDNNPQKMNTVLNVAANVVRHYEGLGETIEVRVVAFNAGLHMLREDTSPVLERLQSFQRLDAKREFCRLCQYDFRHDEKRGQSAANCGHGGDGSSGCRRSDDP